jgi:hypothetical protein
MPIAYIIRADIYMNRPNIPSAAITEPRLTAVTVQTNQKYNIPVFPVRLHYTALSPSPSATTAGAAPSAVGVALTAFSNCFTR